MRQMTKLAAALLALAAVGAWGAGAAQAANPSIHFPGGQLSGILTGEQEAGTKPQFKIGTILGTQAIECAKAQIQSTALEGAEEGTGHVTVGECSEFGEPATVTTNHCALIQKKGPTSAEGWAAGAMECEGEGTGSESTVELADPSLGCTLKFGAQHELTHGTHGTNVGGHVTVQLSVGNIKIKEKVGSGCSFITGNTGTLEGVFTGRAYEDNGNTGTPTTPSYIEGAEIPVEVLNP